MMGLKTISLDSTHSVLKNGMFLSFQKLPEITRLTSNDRSCLTAQTQMPIEATDMNMRGMKTSVHLWRPDSSLSQARSSNMSSRRCILLLITMALYCMYPSPSTLKDTVWTVQINPVPRHGWKWFKQQMLEV